MTMIKASCTNCNNTNCLIKKNCLTPIGLPLIEQKHTFHCKKSQHFILEGAPVHGLFFVYKGKVKVAKTGINGREQIVRFSKDGEIIGHRGFGSGQLYPISAVALEDTILCNFSNDMLTNLLKKVPNLTYDFMLFYADELNKSETKVRKFAQMTVREKVIDAFLYINKKFGQKNGFIDAPLSRKDIADFAGTTEEQVIRVISSLKKEKSLITEGKKIGVTNEETLQKEISEHYYY